jgi:hypothetical protein
VPGLTWRLAAQLPAALADAWIYVCVCVGRIPGETEKKRAKLQVFQNHLKYTHPHTGTCGGMAFAAVPPELASTASHVLDFCSSSPGSSSTPDQEGISDGAAAAANIADQQRRKKKSKQERAGKRKNNRRRKPRGKGDELTAAGQQLPYLLPLLGSDVDPAEAAAWSQQQQQEQQQTPRHKQQQQQQRQQQQQQPSHRIAAAQRNRHHHMHLSPTSVGSTTSSYGGAGGSSGWVEHLLPQGLLSPYFGASTFGGGGGATPHSQQQHQQQHHQQHQQLPPQHSGLGVLDTSSNSAGGSSTCSAEYLVAPPLRPAADVHRRQRQRPPPPPLTADSGLPPLPLHDGAHSGAHNLYADATTTLRDSHNSGLLTNGTGGGGGSGGAAHNALGRGAAQAQQQQPQAHAHADAGMAALWDREWECEAEAAAGEGHGGVLMANKLADESAEEALERQRWREWVSRCCRPCGWRHCCSPLERALIAWLALTSVAPARIRQQQKPALTCPPARSHYPASAMLSTRLGAHRPLAAAAHARARGGGVRGAAGAPGVGAARHRGGEAAPHLAVLPGRHGHHGVVLRHHLRLLRRVRDRVPVQVGGGARASVSL